MQKINDFFHFLWFSFIIDMKRLFVYPVSFWFTFITIPFFSLVQIVFLETIYSQTNVFAGYTKFEAYVLFGTFKIVQSLGFLFFYNRLSEFKSLIRGEDYETFDSALTKPVDSQIYTTLGKYNIGNISSVIVGICIVWYGIHNGNIHISYLNILPYLFLIFLGTCIMYLTFLFLNTLSFWAEEFQATEGLWDVYQNLGRNPTKLYSGFFGIIFNVLVPITLMSGIPSNVLLGKMPIITVAIYSGIIFGLFILTRLFWKFSLKKYSSFSS